MKKKNNKKEKKQLLSKANKGKINETKEGKNKSVGGGGGGKDTEKQEGK